MEQEKPSWMNNAPAAEKPPRNRKAPTKDAIVEATVDGVAVEAELQQFVTVTVPKPFKLRQASHEVVEYAAGVQEMPVEHAEHWYSKANGVEIYRPKK